ncbi:MAG: CDGSH iron-sulfur domain-containing protein [Betaproteobacteria bacterium]|nr:CDGSH iron-sulfur domain-containing protein [Betaproteobacteria bacterium]
MATQTAGGTTTIEVTKDGPYRVAGPCRVFDSRGEETPVRGIFALCRCGNSGRKPFCDGTHARIGFSGRRLAVGSNDTVESYRGKRITIRDNRAICAHSGVCTDNLTSVFRLGREPWIDADGAAAEEIIALVKRCPSGALSCSIDGVSQEGDSHAPAITCSKNGPFYVTGNIALKSGGGAMPQFPDRYALCRCGGSKNKPFCDGTHWAIGFDGNRGRQATVIVPPLGMRRFSWLAGGILTVSIAAAILAIEAAGKWSAPGFYGKAALIPDLNLTLEILLVIGLTCGAWLARRGNLAAHRYNQTVWVLVNSMLVALIMARGMENVALESASDLAKTHYWVPWLHAAIGTASIAAGFWLVMQMNGLLPARLHVRGWKTLMRATLAGYWLVAVLGVSTYYLWFLR